MRICLINPPSPWLFSDRDMPTCSLLILATALKERGHKVTYLDLAGTTEDTWEFPSAHRYLITFTTPQFYLAKRIFEKLPPMSHVILGGPHCSALPGKTLDAFTVDDKPRPTVVVGEADDDIAHIVSYANPGAIWVCQPCKVGQIRMPDYSLLDPSYFQMRTNSAFGATLTNKEGYIQTARGCPYDCVFCAQARITQKKVRLKPFSMIEDEINWHLDNVGVSRFYFYDDTFTINPKRVRLFCDTIKLKYNGKFTWHCLALAPLLSMDMAKEMRGACCVGITFGIESGSEAVLARIGKSTPEDNSSAVRKADNAGLTSRIQLIVGLPGETDETIDETCRWIERLNGVRAVYGVHYFVPLPGSRSWDDLSMFDFDHDTVDFSKFHTIGKGDELEPLHRDKETLKRWRQKVLDTVGNNEIAQFASRK